MGPLGETARAIAASGLDVGLVVVAGRNARLKAELEAHDWPIPFYVYGFTNDLPDFMRAADVLVTKAGPGTIAEAERLAAEAPERYVLLHQFKNPANPAIHEQTTGPEIWEDTDGDIDVLVSGVGTGGTISGVSRYLKKTRGKQILSVAVEPADSPVISQTLANQTVQPGPHKIQGIGAGFIPETLDLSVVDRVEQVSNDEAIEYARRLAREEGLLSGISCGAAAAVAARLAANPEFAGKKIVVILPDSGERYLSSVLFEGIVE